MKSDTRSSTGDEKTTHTWETFKVFVVLASIVFVVLYIHDNETIHPRLTTNGNSTGCNFRPDKDGLSRIDSDIPLFDEVCGMQQKAAASAEQCFPLASAQHKLWTLVCTEHGNSSGTLLIHSTGVFDAAQQLPQAVYRVRVVGHEILQPPVHYCGRLAVANWTLHASGTYSLEVLQLYANFTYMQPPLLNSNMNAATFQFQVDAAAVPPVVAGGLSLHSSLCSVKNTAVQHGTPRRQLQAAFSNNSRRACSRCSGFNHAGRWVLAVGAVGNATAQLLQAMQHTCMTKIPARGQPPVVFHGCPIGLKAASVPQVEDNELLEWLPYTCQYPKITPDVGSKCQQRLGGRKVCFIGDSQTRHLYNQVVHLIEGPTAKFREHIRGEVREKDVLGAQGMLYVADHYGEGAAIFNSSNCSHVFTNFGQWPLSFAVKSPWNSQQYTKQVEKVAQHMHDEQRRYKNKQFWLTTGPLPFLDHQQHKGWVWYGVDWRTEPFVQEFNNLARKVMKAKQLPVVDTWSIAAPLMDLSYDGAHYLGSVGLAQANMVANIICTDVLFGYG